MNIIESKNLANVASRYANDIVTGWTSLYARKWRYSYARMLEHITSRERALELGCADGEMTQHIVNDFNQLTVVDGSLEFLNKAAERVNRPDHTNFVCSLFEDYNPEQNFDVIFLTHVLEHLDDPVALLSKAKQWLVPNGQLAVLVPNANSLHRLAGVRMGLLPKKDALNEQDIKLGHRRVYTPELLKEHARLAGFHEFEFGGVMVKPISNRQIETQWPQELIDATFEMGRDLPDISSEIYLILRNKSE